MDRSASDRQHISNRLHIVGGLLRALDNLSLLNEVVTGSADRIAATKALIATFGFTEVQADHVLDMTISRQTQLARSDLLKDEDDLRSLLSS